MRIGIVGAGYIAKSHSLALLAVPRLYENAPEIELVRIADADLGLAEAGARRWGWEHATDDWRAVTGAPDVDVVHVATPNDVHHELVLDAARHGKHVVCEKPLAVSLADAAEMTRAVNEAGVGNAVCFVYRTWPAVQLMRELVDDGRIGSVRHVRARFLQDYAADPALPYAWRFDRTRAGAGAVGDLGSHLVDLVQFLAGPVVTVNASSRTYVHERPDGTGAVAPVTVDDFTTMQVELDSGATGALEAGWAAPGHKCDLTVELQGDRGSVRFSWERSNEIELYEDLGEAMSGYRTIMLGRHHPGVAPFVFATAQGLGYSDAFAMLLGPALTAFADRSPASPSFGDALRVSETLDAVVASAATRTWTPVTRHTMG